MEQMKSRPLTRVVAPALAATLVTGTVVGVALSSTAPPAESAGTFVAASPVQRTVAQVDPAALADRAEDRTQSISRSARRVTLEDRPEATGHKFATAALKVRVDPRENSRSVSVIPWSRKVAVTGESERRFAEIVFQGRSHWVTAEYLAAKKPKPKPEPKPAPAPAAPSTSSSSSAPAEPARTKAPAPSSSGISSAPCPTSSSIESGLTAEAVRVYRDVCAKFPQVSSYGGWRGDGEHVDGKAIDIMISGETGWQIAEYLRSKAGTFGLYDIIYSQKIWTQQRSSEGWRYMEDRGSTTANHYDHVHVKVF
jgi:hypothetical protein